MGDDIGAMRTQFVFECEFVCANETMDAFARAEEMCRQTLAITKMWELMFGTPKCLIVCVANSGA